MIPKRINIFFKLRKLFNYDNLIKIYYNNKVKLLNKLALKLTNKYYDHIHSNFVYKNVLDFSNELNTKHILVVSNNQYGLIDVDLNEIYKPCLDLLYKYDNYYIIKKNNQFGLLNYSLDEIIPLNPNYAYMSYYNDDLILIINQNSKFGIINIKNEIKIPFIYTYIDFINEKYIILHQSNNYIILNFNYEILYYFDEIYYNDYYLVGKKDGYCNLLNLETNQLRKTNYQDIIIIDKYNYIVEEDGEIFNLPIDQNWHKN